MQFSSRLWLWRLEVAGTPKSMLGTHKSDPQESQQFCHGESKLLAASGIWGTHVWKLHLEISNQDKNNCLGCWVAFSHAQGKLCCFIQSCLWFLESVLVVVSINHSKWCWEVHLGVQCVAWLVLVLVPSIFVQSFLFRAPQDENLRVKVYVFPCD